MMSYNFDEIIDRRNTNSLKWDFAVQRGKNKDIRPFWVADMDFKIPTEITDAIKKRVDHGIFGYSEPLDDYYDSLRDWYLRRYSYNLDTKRIIVTPGVVFSICTLIKSITKEGDNILITEPVYYPFRSSIEDNNRNVIVNEFEYANGKYEFNFIDFENKIKNNNVKLYLLCNPHNPVGRCFTKDELIRISEICKKYDVYVITDEIHADFVYSPNKFTSFASVATCRYALVSAPTKTFNIPGLQVSHAYLPEARDYKLFKKELDKVGYSQISLLGVIAAQSAYKYGEPWLNELLAYIKSNIDYVDSYLKEKLPKIKLVYPEATYLLWLDFSGLGIDYKEINERIINKCNLWLDEGIIFGEASKDFQRINVATPKSYLKIALDALYEEFGKE